jgi:diaminopimelate decarboxylase
MPSTVPAPITAPSAHRPPGYPEFQHRDGALWVEDVPLARIADAVGTPVWVYSGRHCEMRYRALADTLTPLDATICYAVKANANLGILRLFAELGAGFDIVSAGELERVITVGAAPARCVFSGVGKSTAEIDFALKLGIGCFNVESAAELERISARADLLGRTAPISLRVNPDVDAGTHPYISTGLRSNKFGVPIEDAPALYRRARALPGIDVRGVDCHIGSQILSPAPLLEALDSLLSLIDSLAAEGIVLRHLDLGGGMGVPYRPDDPPFDVAGYGQALGAALAGRDLRLTLEPGRFLVANSGVLLTRVEYLKPADRPDRPQFAVVDAAMNDLIRPALYQAWHDISCVVEPKDGAPGPWQIVGPVCESGDFLGHDRLLPLASGTLLAVHSAGAYGMTQSSNYNARPRAAEVLVRGDAFTVVRRRETLRDLLRHELPEP